jgi:hypothetical protein
VLFSLNTVILADKGRYNSFPTFVEHNGMLFLYYREADIDVESCHGIDGKVKCVQIQADSISDSTERAESGNRAPFIREQVVFEGGHEFDAVVSKLDAKLYCLATRSYLGPGQMKTYLSYSDQPLFTSRIEISFPELEWFAFYGKAFKWETGFVFPAYGLPKDHNRTQPFIIFTSNFSRFKRLSWVAYDRSLPSLNETTIIHDGSKYIAFVRGGNTIHGIWTSYSKDLLHWAPPKQEIQDAHAPMAIHRNGVTYLAFRDLSHRRDTSLTLKSYPGNGSSVTIDNYEGSPYDGGYSDMDFVDNRLIIVYYCGNRCGEPSIKMGVSPKNMELTVNENTTN